MTDVLTVAGGIAAIVGTIVAVVAGVWRVGRRARRAIRFTENFFDDWRGEPAREGVPATPGVMERLAATATREEVAEVADRLVRIEDRLVMVEARARVNDPILSD